MLLIMKFHSTTESLLDAAGALLDAAMTNILTAEDVLEQLDLLDVDDIHPGEIPEDELEEPSDDEDEEVRERFDLVRILEKERSRWHRTNRIVGSITHCLETLTFAVMTIFRFFVLDSNDNPTEEEKTFECDGPNNTKRVWTPVPPSNQGRRRAADQYSQVNFIS